MTAEPNPKISRFEAPQQWLELWARAAIRAVLDRNRGDHCAGCA